MVSPWGVELQINPFRLQLGNRARSQSSFYILITRFRKSLTSPGEGDGGLENTLAATSCVCERGDVGIHQKALSVSELCGVDDLSHHASNVVGAVRGPHQGLQLLLQEHILRCIRERLGSVDRGMRQASENQVPFQNCKCLYIRQSCVSCFLRLCLSLHSQAAPVVA